MKKYWIVVESNCGTVLFWSQREGLLPYQYEWVEYGNLATAFPEEDKPMLEQRLNVCLGLKLREVPVVSPEETGKFAIDYHFGVKRRIWNRDDPDSRSCINEYQIDKMGRLVDATDICEHGNPPNDPCPLCIEAKALKRALEIGGDL